MSFEDFKQYIANTGNGVGGSLHIVIYDGNTEDRFIDFCIEQAEVREDTEGVRLGKILRNMSEIERDELVDKLWHEIW